MASLYGGVGAEFGVAVRADWIETDTGGGFPVDSTGPTRVTVGRLSRCLGEIRGQVPEDAIVRLMDATGSRQLAVAFGDYYDNYRFTGLCAGEYKASLDESNRWGAGGRVCRPPFCPPYRSLAPDHESVRDDATAVNGRRRYRGQSSVRPGSGGICGYDSCRRHLEH